jgi:hypothetical protein
MKRSRQIVCLTLAISFRLVAQGQVLPDAISKVVATPEPPAPLASAPASSPAPEWAVWRAFCASLAFYRERAPAEAEKILAERTGLTTAEIESVVSAAGQRYLQQISAVESSARQDIHSQYQFNDSPPTAGSSQAPDQKAAAPQPRVKPPNQSSTRYERLAADGVITRVSARLDQTLRDHKRELAAALTPTAFAGLERFIDSDIAPNVRTVTAVSLAPKP